ncbi:hypothetical protein SHPE106448_21070 [Shewanella pealeana]
MDLNLKKQDINHFLSLINSSVTKPILMLLAEMEHLNDAK